MSEQVELDQILVPTAEGYQPYSLLTLLGFSRRMLRSAQGFGLAPLHFITQRGPYQDGETPLDMRYDVRTVQIAVAERLCTRTDFWDRRWDLLDLLRPNRSFNGTVEPLVYRKWLPAGKIERGTDLETTLNSSDVTSDTGRFIERGLDPGASLIITSGADTGTYTINAVPNDYTLTLSANMTATATNVGWQYRRGWGKRDLYCLLEQGPTFDEGPGPSPFYPTGYLEALRFVAHDPFWYGEEQTETWSLEAMSALVFDTTGASAVRAWFAHTHGGAGYWFFAEDVVTDSIEVIYWGTRFAKPIITITGPAINPIVENTTIGTRIDMEYSAVLGETVTIDTLALTVTNNFGDNLLPYTTGDLATFGLMPAPQAPDRTNVVYVFFGGGMTGTSTATMTWRNRYVGI